VDPAHTAQITTDSVDSNPSTERRTPVTADPRLADDSDGARLLRTDLRVAHLLMKEARDRTVTRVFGVSREDSFLVTMIALGIAAQVLHKRVAQVVNAPAVPAFGDAAIGAGVLRASARRITGAASPHSPALDALLLTALAGAVLGPPLRAAVRGVKASSHRVRVDFDHRYGHLIRRSRARPG
jgi:hypothetical protein